MFYLLCENILYFCFFKYKKNSLNLNNSYKLSFTQGGSKLSISMRQNIL